MRVSDHLISKLVQGSYIYVTITTQQGWSSHIIFMTIVWEWNSIDMLWFDISSVPGQVESLLYNFQNIALKFYHCKTKLPPDICGLKHIWWRDDNRLSCALLICHAHYVPGKSMSNIIRFVIILSLCKFLRHCHYIGSNSNVLIETLKKPKHWWELQRWLDHCI